MFYHIFTGESVYSQALLKLLEKNVNLEEHTIIFGFAKMQDKTFEYSEALCSRIKYLTKPKDLLFCINNIQSANWIYIHYLAYDPSLLYWALHKSLVLKSTWVAWGNDIYSYYKKNNNLKTRIYEILRRHIIRQLPEIAVFVEEDFSLIKSFYKTKALHIPILYPIPVNLEHLEKIEAVKSDSTVRIMIGNSGDPSNLHLEMIDKLVPFRDKDIEILCPLSYGGSCDYKKAVIDRGKEILGDKFVAITELMSLEEYSKFLGRIDISLMNHKRQQGLGNILALLYLGKKVFIRPDITSYYYFKRQNCRVYNIQDFDKIQFEELKAPITDKQQNKAIIKKIISEENYLTLWLNLFNKHV